jgi:CelD/BcsL family acetyltransferase involved in cellulose biosynthesis
MEPRLDVAVLTDTQAFAALEKEWDDLYHTCPIATPYQSWAWLYSWWESYGEGRELRLITVRDEGLLVGLIPLMLLKRGWGFRVLCFMGSGLSPYLDILAKEGWEAKVSEAVRHALRQMNSWHVADLEQVYPTAVAWSIFRDWDGPRTYLQRGNYDVMDVKPWDELLMSIRKSVRSNARSALRRAEGDGVRCVPVAPEGAERAARRLAALHRELLQGRDTDPEHLSGRFESLLVAATRRMTARGLGGISEFWRDGEVIISYFFAVGHGFTFLYQVGASEEARRRYQWSSLMIWNALNIARSKNSTCLSLGLGEHPYKLHWAPRKVPYYRMILGQGRTTWALYLAYRALRLARATIVGSCTRAAKRVLPSRWTRSPRVSSGIRELLALGQKTLRREGRIEHDRSALRTGPSWSSIRARTRPTARSSSLRSYGSAKRTRAQEARKAASLQSPLPPLEDVQAP